jgi:hypothetical protein
LTGYYGGFKKKPSYFEAEYKGGRVAKENTKDLGLYSSASNLYSL